MVSIQRSIAVTVLANQIRATKNAITDGMAIGTAQDETGRNSPQFFAVDCLLYHCFGNGAAFFGVNLPGIMGIQYLIALVKKYIPICTWA